MLEIASMQRGPFTRQHAPDPTIKGVTKTKLSSMKQWNFANTLVWYKFFGIYTHFLWNRSMAFFQKQGVLAREPTGQLTTQAEAFQRNFLNGYFTNCFQTGAERFLSGPRHHMGRVLADFPRSINDFWQEIREMGGWEGWQKAGGAELKTKNNIFSSPIWLQKAYETKITGGNLFKPKNAFNTPSFSSSPLKDL